MAKFGKIEFERRVFPRFTMELPITYEVEKRERQGKTGNASQGGLLVYLQDPVVVDDYLHIKLHVTDPKAPRLLEVSGRIVWVTPSSPHEPGVVKAGIAFEEITDEVRIFLQHFEQIWRNQA